jgi:hypothetical protein
MRVEPEQNIFLSQTEREEGLKSYQKQSFWNGLGINFLNTPIISLLAITFGASNLELGYISSVFHFAGILLIFLPRLLNGARIKTVLFIGWFIRGLICFLYGVLFFLEGQAAVTWILVIYTLFAIARIVGVPMVQPIQRSLVGQSEAGSVVVKINIRLTISQIISQVASFLLMSINFFSGLTGLVLLTWVGAVNNTISCLYVRKFPSRERVEYRKGKNIFVLLAETFKHPVRGKVFIVRMLNMAAGILVTFAVAFLRRSVQMPTNMVFIYTLTGAASALIATQALKPFVDTIGSRPLMVIASLFLAVSAIGLAVLPTDLPWAMYYLVGFFIAFFLRFRLLLMSRLIIKTLPSKDRISYTAMLSFVSAIVGVGVGLGGGALADFSEASSLAVPHIYTLTFLLSAAFSLLGALTALRVDDPGSLSIKETAAALLSVKTLRAYLDIYHLDIADDRRKRESSILSLEQSDSRIATDGIKAQLKSPLPWEQERILRSLSSYPRPELLEDIIREAQDSFSYNRREAIFTLSSYPSKKTERALVACAEDTNPEIAAMALRSLGRIGYTTGLEHVYRIIEDPHVVGRAEIDALRALILMDRDDEYIKRIFSLAPPEKGEKFQQLAFILCARNYGLTPPLSGFFMQENQEKGSGFISLIREAREVPAFVSNQKPLREMYNRSDFENIWRWCTGQLADQTEEGNHVNLRFAVIDAPPRVYTRANTIAVSYFTYQLLKPGDNK